MACGTDALRETSADDRDGFALVGIMLGKVPSLQQRRTDGAEIPRGHRLVVGLREPCRIRLPGVEFEAITTLPTDRTLQRPEQHHRCGVHARNSSQSE